MSQKVQELLQKPSRIPTPSTRNYTIKEESSLGGDSTAKRLDELERVVRLLSRSEQSEIINLTMGSNFSKKPPRSKMTKSMDAKRINSEKIKRELSQTLTSASETV
jgi:hypothetical protein